MNLKILIGKKTIKNCAALYKNTIFSDMKPLPTDFKDLIHCFNSNNVRYLLVGGWAVGVYGSPRATKDIDFLVAVDDDNLANLQKALLAFNSPPVNMESFREKGSVIRIGCSPTQVDIINDADGIDVEECYSRKETVHVDGIDIFVISKNDLIKNKKASGRIMDAADAAKLERHGMKENTPKPDNKSER